MEPVTVVYDRIVEDVMAGVPAGAIIPNLQLLLPEDRQELLCSLCSMYNEIALNCRQAGSELATLLDAECPLFIDGRPSCLD